MTRYEQKPEHAITITILLSMAAVFLADILSPLGMAVWIIYLLPVALSQFLWRPVRVLSLAVVTTVALVIGYFASSSEINPYIAAANRVFGFLIIWIVAAICYQVVQQKIVRRHQEWLQTAQVALSQQMSGELDLSLLGNKVLTTLAEYLNAQAGAIYISEEKFFRLTASYAIPQGTALPQQIEIGQGLLGQAIKDQHPLVVENPPETYFVFGSALGSAQPRQVLIFPVLLHSSVSAVFEFSFNRLLDGTEIELLERLSTSIGIAVRSSRYLKRQQELLEETQQQGEELLAQSEELRVSNEELEEQTRALSESQTRMELQQTELEQTNTQLEEQASLLEIQKASLIRSKAALEEQKQELVRATRYKSEFLANMSHELRTPLNSSLILAKLLSENREGNLNEEQIKFAQTIHAAGNDLLTLINDILDLSKIEAGRIEVRPEQVSLAMLLQNLEAVFKPVAEQKGIAFQTHLHSQASRSVRTDPQRLDQILKNLLSNALKFTEKGEVSLTIERGRPGFLTFAVRDTGIGIAEDQRDVIFEAFRQADGTTNRKYGGTGLGLSISRELARLLGGEIELVSETGEGSTFTLSLPENYAGSGTTPPQPKETRPAPSQHSLAAPTAAATRSPEPSLVSSTLQSSGNYLEDDREKLIADRRIILSIEDDETFSKILYMIAHEAGFQCLLATTAQEGLALAAQFVPSAILLDIGLPDQLGLSVLDRLKHDVRTRHIPVHIVSASDYAETALSLGAVGYMLKPVKREQLMSAFDGLKNRLSQEMRRVLVVEDDAVQLESVRRLLGSPDVETVGVQTAAECLEQLKENTFDCMVVDLSLPDSTGYELLETLSQEDRYSFPPAIVYTGRDLSLDEEQKLRRFSKSIIIKGARSPERLLDEVTLFLHQVVTELPPEQQEMLKKSQNREEALAGRRVLIVEDDVRNVFALTSVLEPRGLLVQIARNGLEALQALEKSQGETGQTIDLVLMDLMMPEMDGLTATREIRKRSEWAKLPIIALTAKAMKSDQQQCLDAGANDYMAKPLDVEKLLSLIRVWMPR